MKNNWNIKISESEKPLNGFFVSVENNGKYVGAIKGVVGSFSKALEAGRDIVLTSIKQSDNKRKHAKQALDLFSKRYVLNDMFGGIYGAGVQYGENGEPYINVLMDTTNEHLMKIIPNSISIPSVVSEYKVVKEQSTPVIAQQKQASLNQRIR